MNNKHTSSTSSSGMGFLSVLGLIFIVLKLLHVIDWPWVWVLAPIWGGSLLGIVILAVYLIIYIAIKKKAKR